MSIKIINNNIEFKPNSGHDISHSNPSTVIIFNIVNDACIPRAVTSPNQINRSNPGICNAFNVTCTASCVASFNS